MHIYSSRIKISLQAMESHGSFQLHLQKVVGEGIQLLLFGVLLGPYKSAIHRGLNGLMCPIIGINCKEVK